MRAGVCARVRTRTHTRTYAENSKVYIAYERVLTAAEASSRARALAASTCASRALQRSANAKHTVAVHAHMHAATCTPT